MRKKYLSMGVFTNQEKIDLYFKAWQEYDLYLLHEVFSEDAKYVIENKNTSYEGIEAICQYWVRNKKRQKGLTLAWHTDLDFSTVFKARFWDCEESEDQEIIGKINFSFDAQGKIVELREKYYKNVYN